MLISVGVPSVPGARVNSRPAALVGGMKATRSSAGMLGRRVPTGRSPMSSHGLTEGGQPHAAAGAIEQFAPELAFQRLDRLAHAGLREGEPFSGTTKVLFLSQGQKDFDLAQLH